MRAIDTNVLIRALVRDDPIQTGRAEAILAGGELYVPVTVVLELELVLRSRYQFSTKIVAQIIDNLASLDNIVMGERNAVVSAASKLAQGWDFADALHHALADGCEDFVTFDVPMAKRAKRGAGVSPKVVLA